MAIWFLFELQNIRHKYLLKNNFSTFWVAFNYVSVVPVKGQYDAYWLSGKDGYDMIDGNKYYKLVFDSYGIEIKCTGDYNAWSMQGTLVDWMKEGFEYDREIA